MGQNPSSVNKGHRRSFRSFVRRSKLNKSNLSHTFSLPPSEEYSELMNINTATEEQLMTLPGVSRQLAREIVRHRRLIGRFKRVDDLALVSGIGAEKLELLRPEICTNNKRSLSRASSCTQSLDSIRVSADSRLCSVNSASVFQLQCVPGLNQELAANIVDYRNKKGPFKSLDDLIKVRGMDIIRLSSVKPHLSLEPRKCESVQHLNGVLANGCTSSQLNNCLNNGFSQPRTPHRKSLSMPTKLPITLTNGFATAPVNDILDLLSAYSHRPIIKENYTYERDGIKFCRLASWNLHQLSVEKVTNPGVKEVICMTVLENKLSLIAIQDIIDERALRIVCDELNSPSLRRVRQWKCNSKQWQYCLAENDNNPRRCCFAVYCEPFPRSSPWPVPDAGSGYSLGTVTGDQTSVESGTGNRIDNETMIRTQSGTRTKVENGTGVNNKSKKLGFIYEASNGVITIEDASLEQILLTDSENQRLIDELNELANSGSSYRMWAQAFRQAVTEHILPQLFKIEGLHLEPFTRWSRASQILPSLAFTDAVKKFKINRLTFYPTHPVAVVAFLICDQPLIIVNVSCEGVLPEVKRDELSAALAGAARRRLPLAVFGDFGAPDNVKFLEEVGQPLIGGIQTTTDVTAQGGSNIVTNKGVKAFNGIAGCVRAGLTHLAIPKGWSWGGPVSPHCPVWAEYNVE
ncbi:hypothetical protein EVAR_80885_1 [Eumeta japonica]|uniref:Endonuclease/exonuclease/phosphatase family domain-containing protein 1 n=1 Tax=Eumeta variegata TaxID=151549 RepID=A0A4C1V0U3_EUMVA|nr:hypothetical protein EVAR_80885_1 [Eumeta japonica]